MEKKFDRYIPVLLIALTGAMAPHVFRLPVWILVWLAALWGYAFLGSRKKKHLPSKRLLTALAFAGFIGAMISYGGALYSDTYVALLAIMSGLKMLEVYSHRDRMVALFLAYFVIITNLFFSDELIMTLYMMVSVFVTTVVMIHIHQPFGRLKDKSRLAGVIMLQSLPLMIILFFLFPRVQGSLLGFTKQRGGASGFSETMSPGSFSNMAKNNDPAFRAQFDGSIPEPDQRYWRGIVLQVFDGRTWKPSIQTIPLTVPVRGKNKVSYTITLEPHKKKWIFALDMPVSSPRHTIITTDYTLKARRNVNKRFVYKVSSCLSYNTGGLHQWDRVSLRLPKGNPKARDLGMNWYNRLTSPEKIVDAALTFLQENNFVYTLKPPLLGKNSVDEFLFQSRKGYCEHYASAFVFLMRAAGVPARVVGGYLGGELNPYGDYLIVHQSEAHAWAEVWLPGKGWTRVDPTAVVAPERVTQGVNGALSDEDLAGLISMPDLGPITDVLTSIRLGWDSVNSFWTLWVMGYTQQDQDNLLSKLGIRTGDRLMAYLKAVLLAVGLIFLCVLFLVFRMSVRASHKKADPLRRLYDRFCGKLAKAGIEKRAGEGPLDYCRRIEKIREDIGLPAAEISDLYIRLRYGKDGNEDDIKRLEGLIKHFHPKPLKRES